MNDEFVKIADCEKHQKATMDLLKEINNRLFRDNGKKSYQTIQNEHGLFIKVQLWILSVIGTALIVTMISLILGVFEFVYMGGK